MAMANGKCEWQAAMAHGNGKWQPQMAMENGRICVANEAFDATKLAGGRKAK